MSNGDYALALKTYRLCPKQDDYAALQADKCSQIVAAQQQLETAIDQKKDLKQAIGNLTQLQKFSPNDRKFKIAIAQRLAKEADKELKMGNWEQSVRYNILAYDVEPLDDIVFKLDRANDQYQAQNKKPIADYAIFKEKKKQDGQKPTPNKPLENEYEKFWSQYPLALKRYNLCLSVVGHQNDRAAEGQILAATKARNALTRGNTFLNQNRFGEAASEYKIVLEINPDDAITKQLAARAYESYGDELRDKQAWSDAKRNYEAALALEYSEELVRKIKVVERKIKQNGDNSKELSPSNPTRDTTIAKPKPRQPPKPPTNLKKPTALVSLDLSGGFNYGLPVLSNQSGMVKSRGILDRQYGVALVLLPQKKMSLVIGANYGIVKFNSLNTNGMALEKFEMGHLQIPVSLRLNLPINDEAQLHFQAGVTANKILKFSYDNYINNQSQNHTGFFNSNTLGFEASVGYSHRLFENGRSRVGLMFTYSRTANVLDLNFKDEATNRSNTSMILSGVGVKVFFRLF
jgi:tetratricopeptide (TPR) repeat protein